jgi:hypothetical protein
LLGQLAAASDRHPIAPQQFAAGSAAADAGQQVVFFFSEHNALLGSVSCKTRSSGSIYYFFLCQRERLKKQALNLVLLAFIRAGHDLSGQIEDRFHIAVFRLDHVEIFYSRLEPVVRWNIILGNIDAPRICRIVDIAEFLQRDLTFAR